MLTLVDSRDVPTHWAEALTFLQPAFDKSPLPICNEVIYRQLIEGVMKLTLTTDGAGVVGAGIIILENREGTKVLHIYMLGFGPEYSHEERADDFKALEIIAADKGCAYMTGYAEPAFARIAKRWGMESVKVMMVKRIGE